MKTETLNYIKEMELKASERFLNEVKERILKFKHILTNKMIFEYSKDKRFLELFKDMIVFSGNNVLVIDNGIYNFVVLSNNVIKFETSMDAEEYLLLSKLI